MKQSGPSQLEASEIQVVSMVAKEESQVVAKEESQVASQEGQQCSLQARSLESWAQAERFHR